MTSSPSYESAVQREMNDMARENQALKERIAELGERSLAGILGGHGVHARQQASLRRLRRERERLAAEP